jgi:hypothetical protein
LAFHLDIKYLRVPAAAYLLCAKNGLADNCKQQFHLATLILSITYFHLTEKLQRHQETETDKNVTRINQYCSKIFQGQLLIQLAIALLHGMHQPDISIKS